MEPPAFCKSPLPPKNLRSRFGGCFKRPRNTAAQASVTFDLYSFRFTFIARDSICFPAGMPGNIVRGGFGNALRQIACVPQCPGFAGHRVRECERWKDCAYARIFEPAPSNAGPSGLADQPRPFVLRVAHLDNHTVAPGQPFWVDVNLFETRCPIVE